MGLDTFAYHKNPATAAGEPMPSTLFSHIPPVLSGGIFSGNGNGSSFRGKVYAGVVAHCTGVNLYQEEIPNPEVGRAAAGLEQWLHQNPEGGWGDISRDEIVALRDWFSTVHQTNGYLVGWW